ncbi:MAG: F0F1 ATP synthase subunit B [Pseudomonadota bacterium]
MFVTSALAATAETADAADGVFPPFDSSNFTSQIFWLVVTFGLLYWLMQKILVPRVSDILETRSDRIANDLDKANEFKEQADEAIAAYEQELATAKAKASEIGAKARDAAKSEADARQSKAEADLADKMVAAEQRISDVRAEAMKEVGSIASDATGSILEQLIGAKATKADLAKVIK